MHSSSSFVMRLKLLLCSSLLASFSRSPPPGVRTAPEAVTVLKFSSASDVFAFGILTFEVFTFGGFPFEAIADDNRYLELLTGTIRGKKVEGELEPLHRPLMLQIAKVLTKHSIPMGAPPPLISTLLQDCLQRNPDLRPTFNQLVNRTRIGSAVTSQSKQ